MFCDISMKLLNYEHLNVLLGLNKKKIKDLKYKTSEKEEKQVKKYPEEKENEKSVYSLSSVNQSRNERARTLEKKYR